MTAPEVPTVTRWKSCRSTTSLKNRSQAKRASWRLTCGGCRTIRPIISVGTQTTLGNHSSEMALPAVNKPATVSDGSIRSRHWLLWPGIEANSPRLPCRCAARWHGAGDDSKGAPSWLTSHGGRKFAHMTTFTDKFIGRNTDLAMNESKRVGDLMGSRPCPGSRSRDAGQGHAGAHTS